MENLFSTFDVAAWGLFLLLGSSVGVVAGLFGVGGGLLIVPALIWVLPWLGVDARHATHIAVGTSLATILVTSLAAIRAHQKRDAVLWRRVGQLTPGILAGAWLGGAVASMLPAEWLQRFYAGFAVLVSLHLFFQVPTRPPSLMLSPWLMTVAGAVIGSISALVGIGGGTMTVPLLHATGVEMRKAVATSSACGLPIALAGTLSFIVMGWGQQGLPAGSTGYVYWPVMLSIVLTSIPFAPLGAALAHHLPAAGLRRSFAVFLFLVGGRLLLD
jgi:uncharacterized membrane protein YfcA